MSENTYTRPSWDEYFMGIARAAAARATCDRGRSGCCIARNKQLLVTGYVGSPSGCDHCDEVGHEFHVVRHPDGHESQHCIRTTHAEQNAICQAARLGISLENGTLYCKMTPCYTCAKMIINSGIKRVVCEFDYHAGERSKDIFSQAGVIYELLSSEMVHYDNM
ncbi:MAG: cytidine/deoxycytidylate deaminase family protein [Patescibacteria group bacterium]|jgi:dCMP deaminase